MKGIKVVSIEFILKSVEYQKLLPIQDYFLCTKELEGPVRFEVYLENKELEAKTKKRIVDKGGVLVDVGSKLVLTLVQKSKYQMSYIFVTDLKYLAASKDKEIYYLYRKQPFYGIAIDYATMESLLNKTKTLEWLLAKDERERNIRPLSSYVLTPLDPQLEDFYGVARFNNTFHIGTLIFFLTFKKIHHSIPIKIHKQFLKPLHFYPTTS
jgi:hypothetical protein